MRSHNYIQLYSKTIFDKVSRKSTSTVQPNDIHQSTSKKGMNLHLVVPWSIVKCLNVRLKLFNGTYNLHEYFAILLTTVFRRSFPRVMFKVSKSQVDTFKSSTYLVLLAMGLINYNF